MARIAVRFLCGVALALLVARPQQAAPQECPGITSAELGAGCISPRLRVSAVTSYIYD